MMVIKTGISGLFSQWLPNLNPIGQNVCENVFITEVKWFEMYFTTCVGDTDSVNEYISLVFII